MDDGVVSRGEALWDEISEEAHKQSMECHQCYNKKLPGGVDSKRLEHLFRWVWMLEILTSEASAGPLSWKIAGKVLVNLRGWFTMVTMSTPKVRNSWLRIAANFAPISNKQIFVGQLFRFQTKIPSPFIYPIHFPYRDTTFLATFSRPKMSPCAWDYPLQPSAVSASLPSVPCQIRTSTSMRMWRMPIGIGDGWYLGEVLMAWCHDGFG